jgi:hypothetical protein
MDAILTILQSALTTALSTAAVLTVLYGFVAWFGAQLFGAKIKSHFDKAIEDYKFELRAHEQAAKIAEYASIAVRLDKNDPSEKYQRANQLSWELFLWLPPDTYRKLGHGLTGDVKELAEALTAVRAQLLKDRAGDLGPEDIIVHDPDIGKTLPPK